MTLPAIHKWAANTAIFAGMVDGTETEHTRLFLGDSFVGDRNDADRMPSGAMFVVGADPLSTDIPVHLLVAGGNSGRFATFGDQTSGTGTGLLVQSGSSIDYTINMQGTRSTGGPDFLCLPVSSSGHTEWYINGSLTRGAEGSRNEMALFIWFDGRWPSGTPQAFGNPFLTTNPPYEMQLHYVLRVDDASAFSGLELRSYDHTTLDLTEEIGVDIDPADNELFTTGGHIVSNTQAGGTLRPRLSLNGSMAGVDSHLLLHSVWLASRPNGSTTVGVAAAGVTHIQLGDGSFSFSNWAANARSATAAGKDVLWTADPSHVGESVQELFETRPDGVMGGTIYVIVFLALEAGPTQAEYQGYVQDIHANVVAACDAAGITGNVKTLFVIPLYHAIAGIDSAVDSTRYTITKAIFDRAWEAGKQAAIDNPDDIGCISLFHLADEGAFTGGTGIAAEQAAQDYLTTNQLGINFSAWDYGFGLVDLTGKNLRDAAGLGGLHPADGDAAAFEARLLAHALENPLALGPPISVSKSVEADQIVVLFSNAGDIEWSASGITRDHASAPTIVSDSGDAITVSDSDPDITAIVVGAGPDSNLRVVVPLSRDVEPGETLTITFRQGWLTNSADTLTTGGGELTMAMGSGGGRKRSRKGTRARG